MNALGILSTGIAATEEKLSASSKSASEASLPTGGATRDTLPPRLHWMSCRASKSIKEQVRARIADMLRGALAAYLPTTDEDSGQGEPTQASGRRSNSVSGKLRTANTTVVHHVTWSHEVIYSPSAHPAIYDQL